MTFTPNNITKAFEKCGIWPLNELIFDEVNFQCSYVTDRSHPTSDISKDLAVPSTSVVSLDTAPSELSAKVTPKLLRPLAKASIRKKCGRKQGKSCIFTSTPELEKIKEKNSLRVKKRKKDSIKKNLFRK